MGFRTKPSDFCSTWAFDYLFLFSLVSFFIVSIFIVTCFSHKTSLTIWIISKLWARRLFSENIADANKPYDAFISYSHHDADFVEKVLYPGLGQYSCCIHTVHWEVGRMIPDQIIESVEMSRRTIIVLSKGYLESGWTKLEFKAAHKQALQDKTQRVIIVLHGSFPQSEFLDEDLQKYIKTNTYLCTDDKHFWSKLRNALPYPRPKEPEKKTSKIYSKGKASLEKKKLQLRVQAEVQLDIGWSSIG